MKKLALLVVVAFAAGLVACKPAATPETATPPPPPVAAPAPVPPPPPAQPSGN